MTEELQNRARAGKAAESGFSHQAALFPQLPDTWLRSHIWLVVLLVIAAGFLVRLLPAIFRYFNPDEITRFYAGDCPSLAAVYQKYLHLPHAPLHPSLLYFWHLLGRSDFMLRLPSVLAGTATLWVAFRWLSNIFGKIAGLVGMMLLAFAPALIYLSGEMRPYAIMILFVVSALYFLECGLRKESPLMMVLFALMLSLSILTHYSAILVALALGLYVLFRIVRGRLPARVAITWVTGQVATAGVYLFLAHPTKAYFMVWSA